jgi:hypothetical protein
MKGRGEKEREQREVEKDYLGDIWNVHCHTKLTALVETSRHNIHI